MHRCVKTLLSCAVFMCAHTKHKYILWMKVSWQKELWDSCRKDEILFCQKLWFWFCKTRSYLFLKLFYSISRENFHLYCLPHLCWLMPWGHQCCFSAGYRQKASFHLARTWGRQQNTIKILIFILAFLSFSESSLGIKVSRHLFLSCRSHSGSSSHRHSLHTEWRWVWGEQQEWRLGNTSIFCSKTWQLF